VSHLRQALRLCVCVLADMSMEELMQQGRKEMKALTRV
jgi:hypothetical protein